MALASQIVCLPLLLIAVLSMAFLGVGVGLVLVPVALIWVRALANLHRELSGAWSGVLIPAPYRPRPERLSWTPAGCLRRCRWLLMDPATWRDLLWLLLEIPVGLVLGLLACVPIAYGVEGIFAAPLIYTAVDWYGYGLIWPIDSAMLAALAVPQGVVVLVLGVAGAPFPLRAHALFCRWLLGPTRAARR